MRKKLKARFTSNIFKNKENDFKMFSLLLLPTIDISYENGKDYDPDYGWVISFSWLFWNFTIFREWRKRDER